MAMTDHDRKKLWGKAAATCSICRRPLVHPAERPEDRDALVGEEAHIVSESPNGPRGFASVPGMNFRQLLQPNSLVPHRPPSHRRATTRLHRGEAAGDKVSARTVGALSGYTYIPEPAAGTPLRVRLKEPGLGMVLLASGEKTHGTQAAGTSFYLLEP